MANWFMRLTAILLLISLPHIVFAEPAQDAKAESAETVKVEANNENSAVKDGASAEEADSENLLINSQYEKIPWTDPFLKVPQTTWTVLKESFGPGTFWPWMGIIGSTALLYHYDEELLLEAQRFGRRIGLGNEDNTKSLIKVNDFSLFRGPTDLGSLFYFLGDGWTHAAFVLGFTWYGHSKNNNRAYNTGLQIMHGMFVSTIFSQAVKRSTGRESPFVRTEPRGKWHPFPSISDYARLTSRRDAFPSGHIMTATLSFTVILENYPEYAYWIRPVEYVWLFLLGYQMMNNGVHWASDYPLGIAMGYVTGKVVARMGRVGQSDSAKKFIILPVANQDFLGGQLTYKF